MTKLHELARLGQSVWCDYIRRSFITSGELKSLIDQGLRGLTSNPSIFEKTIAGSSDYDDELRELARHHKRVEDIYETLALKDIEMAADLFRPVFMQTDGADGYVSIEVNPELAYDTVKTVSEAKRLFSRLHRPNVMIKVPATEEGLPAITHLIGSGVNVNVTLLFGVDNYRSVAEAYMNGLEMLASEGPAVPGGRRVDQVASVASFFVSRVDSAVDGQLEDLGIKDLKGTIAIANAKMAYAEFRTLFDGERWRRLQDKGARLQRLLWGSTGTKNPLYPDTLYVDELIGPDTVNTLPTATLYRFIDHGRLSETLTRNMDGARRQLDQLSRMGIDLVSVAQRLQRDGVEQFAASFRTMMAAIREKQQRLIRGEPPRRMWLGRHQKDVDRALASIRETALIPRIWRRDPSVWAGKPDDISSRLGWLDSPAVMPAAVPGIMRFTDQLRDEGYTHALLLDVAETALAPWMFRNVYGVKRGSLDLIVLDSIDPGAIRSCENRIAAGKTLIIVSSTSGDTAETLSLMNYFYNRISERTGAEAAGRHFIAITDPGSSLQKTAIGLNFRRIFFNDPEIGGRYSALSYPGLIPAAFIGMDLNRLLDRSATMACNCEGCNCPVGGDNTGAWLGAVMGTMAGMGYDKLTLILSPSVMAFGDWLEQLIAQSSGKCGKGIVPVSAEAVAPGDTYSRDRLFVYFRLEHEAGFDPEVRDLIQFGHPVIQLNLKDIYDLGAEIFRWEMGMAVAGAVMKINPFDQPDADSAGRLARRSITRIREEGTPPEVPESLRDKIIRVHDGIRAHELEQIFQTFLSQADAGQNEAAGRSYIAIHAYLNPTPETGAALQDIRTRLQLKCRMATTVGYGSRVLYSTGQLHKGDSGHGMFIQITSDASEDLPVPDNPGEKGSSISFGLMMTASAYADAQALIDAGRRVIRFHLGTDILNGLRTLEKSLNGV